jgi:bacteriorhodopsin
MEHILNNPSLTISLALAAGIIAQSIAHHIRMSAIVLLCWRLFFWFVRLMCLPEHGNPA